MAGKGNKRTRAEGLSTKSEKPPLSPQHLAMRCEAHEALRTASSLFIKLARGAREEHDIAVSGVLEVLVEALTKPAETVKALATLRSEADGLIRPERTGTREDLLRGSGTPLRQTERGVSARALLDAVKDFRTELPDKAEDVFRHLAEIIWVAALTDIESDKDADVSWFANKVREDPTAADHLILSWALQACGMSSHEASNFTNSFLEPLR